MSTSKKKIILNNITVKLGCGGGSTSCTSPKLSTVFQPKPRCSRRRSRQSKSPTAKNNVINYSSTSSSLDTRTTTTTISSSSSFVGVSHRHRNEHLTSIYMEGKPPLLEDLFGSDSDTKTLRVVHGFGRIDWESVAVEKDSDDPYVDFRRSMLQMIVERDIYAKDDLKVLLNCFLQLNSPYYHGVIVKAFAEIWYGIFAARQPPPPPASTITTLRQHGDKSGGGRGWPSRDFN